MTGNFIDRQGTGLADQCISVDKVEDFVDLGRRQIVRKQDGRKTVESACCILLASCSQDMSGITSFLTKDSHKVFNVVRQIDSNTALTGLLPIFS